MRGLARGRDAGWHRASFAGGNLTMDAHLIEFLSLLLRWLHIIAGIAWIGSSFYFI